MTGAAAIEGIRQVDPNGSIALFSAEPDPPYNRPPLTKGLWKGKPVEKIWRKSVDLGVEQQLSNRIQTVNPDDKTITDERGQVYGYGKLLLATGGEPRQLPFGAGAIIYYRTFGDYRHLQALLRPGRTFAVIGGGFIGSEIAAALAMNGQKVVMVFPEEGISARVFPHELALFLNDYYRTHGVDVLPGEVISGLENQSGRQVLKTVSGKEIQADVVIAGIGIKPNTQLAEAAGLAVENGIVVDEYLQTSQPEIYAAGDVAFFNSPTLGKRLRVEHEDNANTMGRIAGQNMAGQSTPYHHLPFFYSDLFDLGYEAVGELDPGFEVVANWLNPYQKGILYYLEDKKVRGVLLWNVWDQVEAARELISQAGPFELDELKARLPV
jgi:NADPH-dependent 2,4-dienoyl-CoA reductase/sulfur reductase-like enzyme